LCNVTLQCCLGGKTFDEANFSAGMLTLPPGASKLKEIADRTELFFVSAAQRGMLHVTINDGATLKMSKGDNFFVPPGKFNHARFQ
jgi:quercetin dioxygenase-like cupin family protein